MAGPVCLLPDAVPILLCTIFFSAVVEIRRKPPHYSGDKNTVMLAEEKRLEQFRGTTILSVRRKGKVVVGGDGQVSLGDTVIKGNARKVRRLYDGKVIAGFAGGTADAFTLFERFEAQLEKHQGQLIRSAVELAKEWRTDRTLQRLEAMLIVADSKASLIITGNGDVMEPNDGILAIGSGSNFARSAAIALTDNTELSALDIVEKSLNIAGDICVYTNQSRTTEVLDSE